MLNDENEWELTNWNDDDYNSDFWTLEDIQEK